MKRKHCVLLPAAGRRKQLSHLIFTEPGVHLLGHPCIACEPIGSLPSCYLIVCHVGGGVAKIRPAEGSLKENFEQKKPKKTLFVEKAPKS